MKQIDLVYRTAFAELAQRTFYAQFQADFPLEGRFVAVPVKGRNYWYFDLPTRESKDKRRYVGPQDALGRAKRDKDLVQASLLSEALVETRQSYLLADARSVGARRGVAGSDPLGPRINARQRQARVGKCPWCNGRPTG